MKPEPHQFEMFVPSPVHIAIYYSERFTDEFLAWLPDNLHVWERFVEETLKIIGKGFQHYSARTIIHVLRHHSALHETGGEYKLNNDTTPYLARLFDLCYPQHAGLFEMRETKKVIQQKGSSAQD